jgi:hypothetical protein
MDLKILKKENKRKLAFWRAIETQRILPFGPIDEVKKMIAEHIEELGESSEYI